MNFTFFIVSWLFVSFLVISHFLKVFRFSLPLFLIYLVFCISYIVNQDLKNIDQPIYADDNPKKNILFQTDNSKVFLPYQSIMGDRGATGIYLILTKRF